MVLNQTNYAFENRSPANHLFGCLVQMWGHLAVVHIPEHGHHFGVVHTQFPRRVYQQEDICSLGVY